MLEFPHDDTGGDQEDALFEMSFFVPKENDRYAAAEGEATQEVSLQCEVPVQTCTLQSGTWPALYGAVLCNCMVRGHLLCPVCCGHHCKSSGAWPGDVSQDAKPHLRSPCAGHAA